MIMGYDKINEISLKDACYEIGYFNPILIPKQPKQMSRSVYWTKIFHNGRVPKSDLSELYVCIFLQTGVKYIHVIFKKSKDK